MLQQKPDWSHASVFDADPSSVSKARDFVGGHLEAHGRSPVAEDLRLIVSELATNAVAHGGGVPFSVSLEEAQGAVRVTVRDDGPGTFAPRATEALAETGRGLVIVDALSVDWGVAADGSGSTAVWATVDVPPAERRERSLGRFYGRVALAGSSAASIEERSVDERSTPGAGARAARVELLCRRGAAVAGVDGAGVSVTVAAGSPHPVACTDPVAAVLEDLQFTTGEGPCFDAVATRAPVLIADLASEGEAVAGRWPAFLDEALRAGVRAVFAFPLGYGWVPLGTLDLYRRAPGALDGDQLKQALVTADLVGLAVVDDPTAPDDGDPGLFRMEVHRAAGMVMVQTGGTIEEALLIMRASAYGEGISVHELARDVVDGRRRFSKEQL